MIIRSKPTKEQKIRYKVRDLKGRNTKEKFVNLIKKVVETLHEIDELNRFTDKNLKKQIKAIVEQYNDQLETTSNEKVLETMILAYDDLVELLDDMTRATEKASYNTRLDNALTFIKDFNTATYSANVKFYEGEENKFKVQLLAITKDVQTKVGKLDYEIKKKSNHILHLEETNKEIAQELASISKTSHKYSEKANEITYNHKELEVNKSNINLLRKSLESFKLLANLFESLALHEDYFNHLKSDGYLRRLVKKLYRRPDQLDIMDNALDLTESLAKIKKEITEVEAIVKPVTKSVYGEAEDKFDEDIVKLYQNMAEKDKE
jgi:hypothetical protein